MSLLTTIFAFILTLGILITFHEWGHFIVARKLGVKVLRFSIGFGKPIWSHRAKDGTVYCIAMIPLGGYVKMLDENEGEVSPHEQAFAFNRKSVWTRIAIVLAGPVANFLFAIIAFILVYSIGTRDFAPIVDTITAGSVAQKMGLEVNDEIIAINNTSTDNRHMVRRVFLEDKTSSYVLTLKRADGIHTVVLPANTMNSTALDEHFFTDIGFSLAVPAVIGSVSENSPAQLAGLQAHDQIISINHQAIHNWFEFVKQIGTYPGQQVTLEIMRDKKPLEITITPESKMHQGKAIGYIGVMLDDQFLRLTRLPIQQAFIEGLHDTWFYSFLTFDSIIKMLIGQMGIEHLSGPISIAVYAGNTVQMGLVYFLQFLALLSISLGVINLLPIPMLDGGHLLYYVVEVIRRKPLSLRVQQLGLGIGLILLASLMVLAFYNDIIQLGAK